MCLSMQFQETKKLAMNCILNMARIKKTRGLEAKD